jgi:sec-independent protein translocase protein TatB
LFDIGWTEMLVVACVAIIVVGPKDLPKMLRTVGKTVGNVKKLAGDFQKQFDDALKEAELDEVKNLSKGKGFTALDDIKESTKNFERDFNQQMTGAQKDWNDAASGASKSSSSATKSSASESELPKPKSETAANKKVAASGKKAAATSKPTAGKAAKSAAKPAKAKTTKSAKSA